MYKILVVDDEKLICKAIKSMIDRLGNPLISEVITSNSAIEAEKLINSNKIDIVITDINMPIISGLDLIRSVIKTNDSIKFIVLSDYDEFQYAKEAIKLGVVDYLLKPATIDELKEVLNKTYDIMKKQDKMDTKLDRNQKAEKAVLENSLNRLFASQLKVEDKINQITEELKANFKFDQFSISLLECRSENRKDIYSWFTVDLTKSFSEEETQLTTLSDHNNNLIIIMNSSNAEQFTK